MTWALSDLLRAIATTIVIGIHASHHWWFGINDLVTMNLDIFLATLINQVGRFTVPIFVILSGFALAKSEEKRPFTIKTFIQRRLWRIVPPYLFFTMLNLMGRSQFINADWQERGQQIWQAVSSGMGDYHLYFLGIILQCYLLYPLLRLIPFTVQNLSILLTSTFLLFLWRWFSAVFMELPLSVFLPNGNHIIYWLPYFQIGIWLCKDRGWLNSLVSRWRSPQWGYLFAIAAVIEVSEFYGTAIFKNSAEAVGHYTRPTVVLLTLTFLLWVISWQNWRPALPHWCQQLWQTSQQQVQIHIKTLANASFIAYLIHVWILRAIEPLANNLVGIFFICLSIACSWLVSIGIAKMMTRIPKFSR